MPTELGRSTGELAWSGKLDISNQGAELQGLLRTGFRTYWYCIGQFDCGFNEARNSQKFRLNPATQPPSTTRL